jgi:hypothetical protein
MMAEYYTMETVRDQILKSGKVYPGSVSGFPSDWNYCPCVTVKRCEMDNRISCSIEIGISFNDPHTSISVIELIYVRENHQGFIRTNHMQLNKLIKKGILDINTLKIVTF